MLDYIGAETPYRIGQLVEVTSGPAHRYQQGRVLRTERGGPYMSIIVEIAGQPARFAPHDLIAVDDHAAVKWARLTEAIFHPDPREVEHLKRTRLRDWWYTVAPWALASGLLGVAIGIQIAGR